MQRNSSVLPNITKFSEFVLISIILLEIALALVSRKNASTISSVFVNCIMYEVKYNLVSFNVIIQGGPLFVWTVSNRLGYAVTN